MANNSKKFTGLFLDGRVDGKPDKSDEFDDPEPYRPSNNDVIINSSNAAAGIIANLSVTYESIAYRVTSV